MPAQVRRIGVHAATVGGNRATELRRAVVRGHLVPVEGVAPPAFIFRLLRQNEQRRMRGGRVRVGRTAAEAAQLAGAAVGQNNAHCGAIAVIDEVTDR